MPSIEFSVADERDALTWFLDLQREALVRKLDGVSDRDARRTPTASSLSLLAILKHSAVWERRWFQVLFAGRDFPDEWPTVEVEEDADLVIGEEDTVAHWLAYYEEQVAQSRAVAAGADLGTLCARPEQARRGRNLRWVLLHMIEESARHAGHADIIRETLDGARGI